LAAIFHVWERHKLSSDLRGFSSVNPVYFDSHIALEMTHIHPEP